MTKLLALTAILLTLACAMPAKASVDLRAGGDNVFPLDNPLPFPWDSIDGVWRVEDEGFSALFSFEVQNDCSHRQVLKVMQLHGTTGRVIAEGIGTKEPLSQQVYAAMKGDGGPYMLYVGAFRTKGLFPQNITGLRIYSFTTTSPERRYRIYKVEAEPAQRQSSVSDSGCK